MVPAIPITVVPPREHPRLDFLTNPFSHRRGEPFRLLFASVHSYVVPNTGWRSPARHESWVLDVASEWPLRERVSGRDVVRPPGSVALYAPHTVYQEFNEEGKLQRMAWLMFRVPDRCSPLWSVVKPHGYCIFDDPGGLVRDLIQQIAFCFLNQRPGADWLAHSAFYQVLALLRLSRNEPQHRIQRPNMERPCDETSLRGQVEKHLYAQAHRTVTATEMARHLHMSLSAFTHHYHQQVGETFVETRTRIRIERAKALLLRGDVSIKQVAANLGFSDAARFSRVFHRVTGLSPLQFVRELAPRTN